MNEVETLELPLWLTTPSGISLAKLREEFRGSPSYLKFVFLRHATITLLKAWFKEVMRSGLCVSDSPPGKISLWPIKWKRLGCVDVSLYKTALYLRNKILRNVKDMEEELMKRVSREMFQVIEVELRKLETLLRALPSAPSYVPSKYSRLLREVKRALAMYEEVAGLGRKVDEREYRGEYVDKLFEYYVAYLIISVLVDKETDYLPRLNMKFKPQGVIYRSNEVIVYWNKSISIEGCSILGSIKPDLIVDGKGSKLVVECKFHRDEANAIREAIYQLSFYLQRLEGKGLAVVRGSETRLERCGNLFVLKLSFKYDPARNLMEHRRIMRETMERIGVI